jgi:putative acetyltransferase
VIVRPEAPADRDGSLAVERAAFGGEEEAAIIEAVRDEPGSFALVAEEDGRIVGHVQMSRAWIGGVEVLALGPIAVHPEHQGRGIGSVLIGEALEEARLRAVPAVVLLGDPDFYPRYGFEPASAYRLRNPFTGVQPDGFVVHEEDFMLAALDDRARSLRGDVRWDPAFGQPG